MPMLMQGLEGASYLKLNVMDQAAKCDELVVRTCWLWSLGLGTTTAENLLGKDHDSQQLEIVLTSQQKY